MQFLSGFELYFRWVPLGTSPSNFYSRYYSPRCILTHSPQDISPKKKRLLKLVELFSVHIWPKQNATAAQNVVYKSRKTLSSLPDAFNLQLQKFGHAQKAKSPPPLVMSSI